MAVEYEAESWQVRYAYIAASMSSWYGGTVFGILFPSNANGSMSATSVLNTAPTAFTSDPLNGPPGNTCALRRGAISRA